MQRSSFLMLGSALLVACGDKDEQDSAGGYGGGDGTVDCTTEARSSVSVTILDESGQNLVRQTGGEGISATYTVDGGDVRDCESMVDAVVCGWEVAGDFVITVDATGYVPEERSLTVGADECHVISETVEITLVPLSDSDG